MLLARPKIEGWLSVSPKLVRGENLQLTSARISGKISLLLDLVTGRFEVVLSGSMKRYLIPGLGIVDVMTDLKVVPGPNRHGMFRRSSARLAAYRCRAAHNRTAPMTTWSRSGP